MSNHTTLNPKGKAELYAPMLKPLSQLELSGKRGTGGSLRDRARAEANRQAYDDGFAQGLAEGAEEGMRQFEAAHAAGLEAFAEELSHRADRLDAAFKDWCSKLEGPLAELAVVIAARIIARELESDPETVLGIARQAVAEVTHASEARIKVNPFDSEVISAHRATLLAASGGLRNIEIVEDPAILGGCIVETDGGSIDSRIESMLERAKRGLRGDR